jgi:hypothetical protein
MSNADHVVINPAGHDTLIGIDTDVLAQLTDKAVPFIDDPNTVLRRALGIDRGGPHENGAAPAAPRRSKRPKSKRTRARAPGIAKPKPPRAPKGSLTPEEAFEEPILAVLDEAGGSLPVREAISAVGERMGDVLNEHDRFQDDRRVARWEKRVPFVRLRLVQRGLLKKEAPRGVWEITEAGREYLGAIAG